MTSKPQTTRRSKTKPKRKKSDHGSYLFRVVSAAPSYSIMRQFLPGNLRPYMEFFNIEAEAECVFPVKLRGRQTRLSFIADRKSINDRVASKDDLPRGVGYLTMRGDKSEFSGFLPHDVTWGIASSLESGAFRYVQLDGDALHRGHALITGTSFSAGYDENDFVDPG